MNGIKAISSIYNNNNRACVIDAPRWLIFYQNGMVDDRWKGQRESEIEEGEKIIH